MKFAKMPLSKNLMCANESRTERMETDKPIRNINDISQRKARVLTACEASIRSLLTKATLVQTALLMPPPSVLESSLVILDA